jgi:hypothetical protein
MAQTLKLSDVAWIQGRLRVRWRTTRYQCSFKDSSVLMATYTHPHIQHVVDCMSLYQCCPGCQLTRGHGASSQCVLQPHIVTVSTGCELLLAPPSCNRGDLSGQNTGRNPHSATPSRSRRYTSPSSVNQDYPPPRVHICTGLTAARGVRGSEAAGWRLSQLGTNRDFACKRGRLNGG